VSVPDQNLPNAKSSGSTPVIYQVSSWKILKGGGSLKFNNGTNVDFTYKAPASVPANVDNSIVDIAVELSPHDVGNGTQHMAKVILMVTLYIVQNETALVVHLPEAGFNDTKYINNTVGGVSIMPIDPRIPASQSADLRVQMAMVKSQMAQVQKEKGIDLNAITSNAKVIYTADKNFTTISFTQLGVQVNGGTTDLHPSPGAVLTIVFEGKPAKGGHPINLEPSEVALVTFSQKACTCGKDYKDDPTQKPLPCAGMVVITEVTDKIVKGYIMSRLYFSNNGNKFSGWINGDFSALLATH